MPDRDEKRAAFQALVNRVLTGEGTAPAELRGSAFRDDGLPTALDGLIGKVVGILGASAPVAGRPGAAARRG